MYECVCVCVCVCRVRAGMRVCACVSGYEYICVCMSLWYMCWHVLNCLSTCLPAWPINRLSVSLCDERSLLLLLALLLVVRYIHLFRMRASLVDGQDPRARVVSVYPRPSSPHPFLGARHRPVRVLYSSDNPRLHTLGLSDFAPEPVCYIRPRPRSRS